VQTKHRKPERTQPLVASRLSESARKARTAVDYAEHFLACIRRCATYPDRALPEAIEADARQAIALIREAQEIRRSEAANNNTAHGQGKK